MLTYEAYTCTFDLLAFIPSLTDAHKSVKEEIYEFNERHVPNSHARLMRNGQKIDASTMGFSNRDKLDLIATMAASEESLGAKRIEDVFAPSFFTTNFWYMWVTTFAFQPWHSAVELRRYMHRFIQELSRINTLAGVRRTPYNQYDSIVLPIVAWLKAQSVHFVKGAQVTDLTTWRAHAFLAVGLGTRRLSSTARLRSERQKPSGEVLTAGSLFSRYAQYFI